MRNALLAAALSLALHAVGLAIFLQEAAPTVMAVAGPREKPVQIEVMRLAGLIFPAAKQAPPAAAVPSRPLTRIATRSPAPAVDSAPALPGPSAAPEPGPEAAQPGQGEGDGAGEPSPGESGPNVPGVAAEGPKGPEAPLDTAALSRRLQQVALRCYPAAARRFRQTGEAQVRFCLDGAGALRESKVIHSTGSALLDHAATDCVVPGAAPFGPETFGRCFAVPVRFNP